MTIPRTTHELEQAAAEAEAWLDSIDPTALEAEDISDLRAITQAVGEVANSQNHLVGTVAAARRNGRSWSRIGMALGVSRQAARERYAALVEA